MSLTWIVAQSEAIAELSQLNTEAKGLGVWLPITKAKSCLMAMFSGSAYRPYFRVSFDKADKLFDLLQKFVPDGADLDVNLSLNEYDIFEINETRRQFEVFR